jgi:hypothetical protein
MSHICIEICKGFVKNKKGNSADINLFLTGMLKAAGLEVYPILLSTRNHGKISANYPFLDYFNYVIVYAKIDDSLVLLDATEPLCNFNELPTRCLNDYGFIVQKKKEEWLQFHSNFVSEMNYNFIIKLNANNDSIINRCKLMITGYDAIDYRKKFANGYDKVKDNLIGKNSVLIDSIKFVNLYEIQKPFGINFKEMMRIGFVDNKIIISPFCFKAITENPLKMPERNYPIDMVYRKSKSYHSTIVIPNGYKIFSKPANIEINDSLVHLQYMVDVDNESVDITGVYEFKKDVYPKSDYFALKEYFNKIVDKFNEKVVFVKE